MYKVQFGSLKFICEQNFFFAIPLRYGICQIGGKRQYWKKSKTTFFAKNEFHGSKKSMKQSNQIKPDNVWQFWPSIIFFYLFEKSKGINTFADMITSFTDMTN